MKRDELSRALGDIDSAYIQEADEEIQPSRKSGWGKPLLAIAACLAILVTSVSFLQQRTETEGCPAEEMETPNDGDCAVEILDETGKLVCNEAVLPAEEENLALLDAADFVPMDHEALLNYFGTALPIPARYPDLQPVPAEAPQGIYRREQGRGAVYHDVNCFAFSAQDGSRSLTVTLSKASHPAGGEPQVQKDAPLEFTPVNGRKLAVFRDAASGEKPVFTVQWMEQGVGWTLLASGWTEEAFVELLSGLVVPGKDKQENFCKGKLLAIDKQARSIWVSAENNEGIRVKVPETVNLEELHLYDRVGVAWHGEPATLNTVWAQQLDRFTLLKGEEKS